MNTEKLTAQREKLAGELANGLRVKLAQAATKNDRDKARELTIEKITLVAMVEALDGEIAAARRRELTDELKRLNDEHAKAFLVAQNARRHSDDLNTAYTAKWIQGLAEVIPTTPDEMRAKGEDGAAATQAYNDARRCGAALDELKQRIVAIQSQLEVLS